MIPEVSTLPRPKGITSLQPKLDHLFLYRVSRPKHEPDLGLTIHFYIESLKFNQQNISD
jgi:hypothetical protein